MADRSVPALPGAVQGELGPRTQPGSELRRMLRAIAQHNSPAQVAVVLGMPDRSVRRAVERLVGLGLVRREGSGPATRWELTAAGLAELGGLEDPGLGPEGLDAWVARLPTGPHQAAFRLMVTGTVARWYLGETLPSGWGCLLLVGPTKSGKTYLARAATRVLGLQAEAVVRLLGQESPGAIVGRRQPAKGGWRFVPSPLVELPMLVLDELDKTGAELRREAVLLALGNARLDLEGAKLTVRPYVVLVANAVPSDLPEAVRRRAPVLDTAALEPSLADIDLVIRDLEGGSWPRLALENLRPPMARLPEDAWRAGRAVLRNGLTASGWRLCDPEAWLRPALGRLALQPGLAPERAAVETAVDCLAVAATTGAVDREHAGAILQHGGLAGLASAEALESALASLQDRERAAVVTNTREALALTETRRVYMAEVEQALAGAEPLVSPGPQGWKAAALQLRDRLSAARDLATLDAIWEAGAPVLQALRARAAENAEAKEGAARVRAGLVTAFRELGPVRKEDGADYGAVKEALVALQRVRDQEGLRAVEPLVAEGRAAIQRVQARRAQAQALAQAERYQREREREARRLEEVARKGRVRQLRAALSVVNQALSSWNPLPLALQAGLVREEVEEALEPRRRWLSGRQEWVRRERRVLVAPDGREIGDPRAYLSQLQGEIEAELRSLGAAPSRSVRPRQTQAALPPSRLATAGAGSKVSDLMVWRRALASLVNP